MSLFKRITGRKKVASSLEFPQLVEKLKRELRAHREQWWFGVLSTLKSEGVEYENVSWILEEGTDLDSVLKGFQLTCIVGFASEQEYFTIDDLSEFERQLKRTLAPLDLDLTTKYNERYLDCTGDIDCLTEALIDDVLGLTGDPAPTPPVRSGFKASVPPFAILSQAATASVFGDQRTEKELKSLLRAT